MKSFLIGVSGVARSGKDTFCKILTKQLVEKGKTVIKMALADALKQDCEQFVKDKLGMNVWTDDAEEKALIRPLLVWIGDVQRRRTNGRYWVEKLNEKIKTCNDDFILVSDVRYAYYAHDEIQWVQKEHNGLVVHISKYAWVGNRKPFRASTEQGLTKVYVEPPNEHERLNDPKVKSLSDIKLEWEDQPDKDNLVDNEPLNNIVKGALTDILSKIKQ